MSKRSIASLESRIGFVAEMRSRPRRVVSSQQKVSVTSDENLKNFFRRIAANIDRQATRARIECGHLIAFVTDNRDAVCLKPLARGRQIQNNLCSGANHDHWRARELRQISGNI